MTNEADYFNQAGCLAGERRRKTWKSLGKDASIAPLIGTASAPDGRR
jgi:hypothetical protein